VAAAVAVLAPAVAGGGGGGGVVRHGGADEDGRDGQHRVGGLRREADLIACKPEFKLEFIPPSIRVLTDTAGLGWYF
jgi:hypothetical protein